MYGQLIKSLDRDKIVEMSRRNGGEKYVKSFDEYTHLVTMLFAVIMRFDSLREIEAAMTAEVRKLHHIGIETARSQMRMPGGLRSSSRKYTATCMSGTGAYFRRTAGETAARSG